MAQASVLDDDDLLSEVLSHCVIMAPHKWPAAFASLCRVSQRFHRLAQHDSMWRPACELRWSGQIQESQWVSAKPSDVSWKAHYRHVEQELVREHPVFAMGGALQMGRPFSIHFFEPRYRRLIAIAMERDRKYVFASSLPRKNDIAWLCEAHQVHIHPDGRADLITLPVAQVKVLAKREEKIANGAHPSLSFATVELMPWAHWDPSAHDVAVALDRVRTRLDELGQQAHGDDDEEGEEEEEEEEGEEEEGGEQDDEEEGEDVDEEEGEDDDDEDEYALSLPPQPQSIS